MKDGFIKAAAYSPAVALGDPEKNADAAIAAVRRADAAGARILVLPELFLTGYTCADIFFQIKLLRAAEDALGRLLDATSDTRVLCVVGLPVRYGTRLYNCAAVLYGGRLLGVVPKTYIPNYCEFYEGRHFAPAPSETGEVTLCGRKTPFGTKLLFAFAGMPDAKVAVEICEDFWVPVPPACAHAGAGATLICNLSASNEAVGKGEYRKMLVESASARCTCGYLYASAGKGESTTDLVFSGHNMLCENGVMLAESQPFADDSFTISEFDCEKLAAERLRMNTFAGYEASGYTEIEIPSGAPVETVLTRAVSRHPFIPDNASETDSRCDLILEIQSQGLARRMEAAHAKTLVIGVSGGLDSSLALLVAVRACQNLGRNSADVHAVTMPCFGTTARTKSNAEILCRALGVIYTEIDIKRAVDQHFADIGQDPEKFDVTYENAQARERTQILMDIANKESGIVVGTGDLSELALGFATYNGDHMSMYGVNASVPKTLIRYIVRRAAGAYRAEGKTALAEALLDILNTPVSPELLPPTKGGTISQETESIVGPYELHDFFLYHMVRFGCRPRKIFRLALYAFQGEYGAGTIAECLEIFLRRFFAQQFKRSCIPDGPKVGSVALSPRGDFRMPSDMSAEAFLCEIREIRSELGV